MKCWMMLSVVLLFTLGCGSDPEPRGFGETNGTSGTITTDYCEEFGWYSDGNCDDFCKLPDPDCSNGPSNNTVGPPPDPGPGPTPVPDPDPGPTTCDDVDWERDYVGFGEECMLIDFACVDGSSYFEDDCGCGCELLPSTGPACDHLWEQGRPVWVEEDPDVCATIRFTCADGQEAFSDECGCGCIEPWDGGPLACLADTPDVIRYGDLEECTMIDFICEEEWIYFQDDCGCGCRRTCSDDFECTNGYCEDPPPPCDTCGVSLPPVCIYPNCDDGLEILCDALPPICPEGQVAAAIGGCYQCLDARTCGPPMGP